MSGYGAGFEDLNVKIGQLAIAYLGGARQDIVTENGRYAKNNLDVRLYDVNAPLGKVGFWYNLATAKGGALPDGTVVPTITGQAFGFGHLRPEMLGGYNRFSIQYGRGAASNFSTSIDTPTSFLKDASTLLVTEHLLIQPSERFSIMPIFIYQRHKSGRKQDGTDEWISFGARPVFNLSDRNKEQPQRSATVNNRREQAKDCRVAFEWFNTAVFQSAHSVDVVSNRAQVGL
jgi:maltoporin